MCDPSHRSQIFHKIKRYRFYVIADLNYLE